MPANRSTFRSYALLSGLVTQDQIDAAEEVLRAEIGSPYKSVAADEIDGDALAEQLVRMEVLTNYQAMQLKAGRTLFRLGPYVMKDFVGQGGMGQVFKAEHEIMGRECAVKVLPRDKCTPAAIAHFRREIRTQARLDHENLVRAYDAGEEGKVHFLVTEYVPGTDLRKLVRSEGRLSVQQAASIIMQSARGLQYAHERGLVHRDVKPGNILVTPNGVAKVSDLGLAGVMNDAEEDPRAGKIVGTADYLAPEQIRNPHEILPVSDIYSLGCTLYYAITGKVPYPGGSPSSKAKRHLEETPWHPQYLNKDVSDEFVDIIADMMEKDPDNRVATAAEVAARLEPWASETTTALSHPMTKSPWMSPPLPTAGVEAEKDEGIYLRDTGSASYDPAEVTSGDGESASQISQGTPPVGGQETRKIGDRRRPPPPLLPMEVETDSELSRTACVAIAMAVAIPLSLIMGGIIGFVLGRLL